jgi:hypothetical protein
VAKAPPKPTYGPKLTESATVSVADQPVPADVMAAWRGLWHAIGSNLPWYVNHSRANRRAMRASLKAHGR